MDINERIVEIAMRAKSLRISSWVNGRVQLDFGDVGKEGSSYDHTFTKGNKASLLEALEAAMEDSKNWPNPRLSNPLPKTEEDKKLFEDICFVAKTVFSNCTIEINDKTYSVNVKDLLLNWDPINCESSMWYVHQWMMDKKLYHTLSDETVTVSTTIGDIARHCGYARHAEHDKFVTSVRRATIAALAELLRNFGKEILG